MNFSDETLDQFTKALLSDRPVPGGGGAAALCGAIAVSLSGMVGSLTVGKKKYADVSQEVSALIAEAEALRCDFLRLIDEDARAFLPLSEAYRLPADTEAAKREKASVMEHALHGAAMTPLAIMEKCCAALDLTVAVAQKGARIALSDAGCAAALCRAALSCAALNVLVNTAAMSDRTATEAIDIRANDMLARYSRQADSVYEDVRAQLLG